MAPTRTLLMSNFEVAMAAICQLHPSEISPMLSDRQWSSTLGWLRRSCCDPGLGRCPDDEENEGGSWGPQLTGVYGYQGPRQYAHARRESIDTQKPTQPLQGVLVCESLVQGEDPCACFRSVNFMYGKTSRERRGEKPDVTK